MKNLKSLISLVIGSIIISCANFPIPAPGSSNNPGSSPTATPTGPTINSSNGPSTSPSSTSSSKPSISPSSSPTSKPTNKPSSTPGQPAGSNNLVGDTTNLKASLTLEYITVSKTTDADGKPVSKTEAEGKYTTELQDFLFYNDKYKIFFIDKSDPSLCTGRSMCTFVGASSAQYDMTSLGPVSKNPAEYSFKSQSWSQTEKGFIVTGQRKGQGQVADNIVGFGISMLKSNISADFSIKSEEDPADGVEQVPLDGDTNGVDQGSLTDPANSLTKPPLFEDPDLTDGVDQASLTDPANKLNRSRVSDDPEFVPLTGDRYVRLFLNAGGGFCNNPDGPKAISSSLDTITWQWRNEEAQYAMCLPSYGFLEQYQPPQTTPSLIEKFVVTVFEENEFKDFMSNPKGKTFIFPAYSYTKDGDGSSDTTESTVKILITLDFK
jgi:hypothetical protein